LTEDKEQPGLGRVVYSVDDKRKKEEPQEKQRERAERAEVEEADADSFPASDAPSFAGGKDVDCD
jgi:hypothetical protein